MLSIKGVMSEVEVWDGKTIYNDETVLELVNSDPRFDGNYFLSKKEVDHINPPEDFEILRIEDIPGISDVLSEYSFPFGPSYSVYPSELYAPAEDKLYITTCIVDYLSFDEKWDFGDVYVTFEYDRITGTAEELERFSRDEYFDRLYPEDNDVWYESDSIIVFDDENGDLAIKYKDTDEVIVIYDNFTDEDFYRYLNENPEVDGEEALVLYRGADMIKVWHDQYIYYYVFGYEWSIGGGFFDTKTRTHSSFSPGALLDMTDEKIIISIAKNEELGFSGGIYSVEYKENMSEFGFEYIDALNNIGGSWSRSIISPGGRYFAIAMSDEDASDPNTMNFYVIDMYTNSRQVYSINKQYANTIKFTGENELIAYDGTAAYLGEKCFFVLKIPYSAKGTRFDREILKQKPYYLDNNEVLGDYMPTLDTLFRDYYKEVFYATKDPEIQHKDSGMLCLRSNNDSGNGYDHLLMYFSLTVNYNGINEDYFVTAIADTVSYNSPIRLLSVERIENDNIHDEQYLLSIVHEFPEYENAVAAKNGYNNHLSVESYRVADIPGIVQIISQYGEPDSIKYSFTPAPSCGSTDSLDFVLRVYKDIKTTVYYSGTIDIETGNVENINSYEDLTSLLNSYGIHNPFDGIIYPPATEILYESETFKVYKENYDLYVYDISLDENFLIFDAYTDEDAKKYLADNPNGSYEDILHLFSGILEVYFYEDRYILLNHSGYENLNHGVKVYDTVEKRFLYEGGGNIVSRIADRFFVKKNNGFYLIEPAKNGSFTPLLIKYTDLYMKYSKNYASKDYDISQNGQFICIYTRHNINSDLFLILLIDIDNEKMYEYYISPPSSRPYYVHFTKDGHLLISESYLYFRYWESEGLVGMSLSAQNSPLDSYFHLIKSPN